MNNNFRIAKVNQMKSNQQNLLFVCGKNVLNVAGWLKPDPLKGTSNQKLSSSSITISFISI
jgi:hypothetical protein